MSAVFNFNGTHAFDTKNLGWLLRHASEVTVLELFHSNTRETVDAPAWLHAHLSDGRLYQTLFQSRAVLRAFVARRVFAGATVADRLDTLRPGVNPPLDDARRSRVDYTNYN